MQKSHEKIIIIGATSTIAEHCARLWIKSQPKELILIGRNLEKLNKISSDLNIRSPQTHILVIDTDFSNSLMIQEVVKQTHSQIKTDLILIAHGMLPNQKECEENLVLCQEALTINGTSPILFAEGFVKVLEKQNHGTLAVIGSVAGDRGRKSNYIYGAAKCMVSCYMDGLQHRLAKTNVNAVLIKPGPTETPMTAHLVAKGQKCAPVEKVAKEIVSGITQHKSVIYTPRKWRLIMFIVCALPKRIFNLLEV